MHGVLHVKVDYSKICQYTIGLKEAKKSCDLMEMIFYADKILEHLDDVILIYGNEDLTNGSSI